MPAWGGRSPEEMMNSERLVLEYVFDVNTVTEMTLKFRCPPWMIEVNVQLSPPH